jgi:tetratricopeptide (TPR) repeat protein
VRRKKHSIERRDYHSLTWLEYVYLQQGRIRDAEAQLSIMQKSIADLGAPIRGYPYMAAAFIVETERWELIDKLFGDAASKSASLSTKKEAGADICHIAAKTTTTSAVPASTVAQPPRQSFKQLYGNYVRGLAAASAKNPLAAEMYVAEMREQRREFEKPGNYFSPEMVEIMELEVSALARANTGKFDEAIELLRRATNLEEKLRPPSGPPDMIKPSHELLGEVLLRANRQAEAAAQFQTALLRQPNRPRSLLGLARAARTSDAKLAAQAYSDYLHTQERADARAAELTEARDYLKQASAR